MEYLDYPDICSHLIAKRKSQDPEGKNIMILGHMDTVFEKGTAAKRPYTVKDGVAYGPGVLDMKSGIVIAIYAIKALLETQLLKHNVTFLIAGDEEWGHPETDIVDRIKEIAKEQDAVFNMETGSDKGTVCISRSGIYYPKIRIEGIEAHSGKNPEQGATAVKELCHKILDLYEFCENDEDISFNAGVISGGVAANMIAGEAEMHGNFRFMTVESAKRILAKLQEITTYSYVPKTKTIIINDEKQCFMPMEKTEGNVALYNIVKQQADKLGIEAEGIFKNAGADSCWTTMVGAPTICAMGGRGELSHSDKEYLRLNSLTERAKLLAFSIDAID